MSLGQCIMRGFMPFRSISFKLYKWTWSMLGTNAMQTFSVIFGSWKNSVVHVLAKLAITCKLEENQQHMEAFNTTVENLKNSVLFTCLQYSRQYKKHFPTHRHLFRHNFSYSNYMLSDVRSFHLITTGSQVTRIMA